MSITVQWDKDENTIICFTYAGSWEIEEFFDATAQSEAMMATVDHTVDVILDMRNCSLLPRNFIFALKKTVPATRPNMGLFVLVGASPVITVFSKQIGRLLSRKGSKHFEFAATLDEARTLIAKANRSITA